MKHLLFLFCLLFSIELMAQDKIFLKSGDTLHVVISQRDDKSVSYTAYDDPEFNTQSISTDLITKIQLNNGKIIDLKKSKYPGYYVGICFGNAFPVSDFGHAEANDNRSGFAKDKPFLSFEGRMRVFRIIGVQADISVGSFGVNSAPYFDYLNSDSSSTTIANGKLSDYRYATFSAGPDLGFYLGKRLKVFVLAEVSFMSIANKDDDQIYYNEKLNGVAAGSMTRSSRGIGSGAALGAKIDFMLSKHIGIGASAKFQDYDVEVKVEERYTNGTNINYKWNQSVSYFNVGLNLHYHFK